MFARQLMSPNTEANMNGLKRLWTKIAHFTEMLEGMDDPKGDYILSLGKRVDRLERDVEDLEAQLHSRPGGGGIQQSTIAQSTYHAH
jgi:hypothetical protein